ncbi:MAG: hypothetical protein AAF734_08540, partial [Bacteroidota bacterium]
ILQAQEQTNAGLGQRYMPSDDPNLNANWDWTTSAGHTAYYQTSSGIQSRTIYTPFFTNGHPLNTVTEKDMEPADGWVLVYRDFGTASAAPELPFFVLYNKYLGTLRVMVHNSQDVGYNQFEMRLYFKSQSYTGGILTFSDPTSTALDDYDKGKSEMFLTAANQFGGWIWGDFQLFGYDPDMSASTQLRLDIYGINISDVNLNSTAFTIDEVLTDANPGGSKKSVDLLDAASKGAKFFSDLFKITKAWGEASSKEAAANRNPWWKARVDSYVSSGLTNRRAAVEVFAAVSSLAGFIGSFIGGKDKPLPRQPMSFEGNIAFEGSITTSPFPIFSRDFGLAYIGDGPNPSDYYRPLNSIKWGVFSLNTKPTVDPYYDEEISCDWNSHWNECECDDDYSPPPYGSSFSHYQFANISYSFNPYVGLTLSSIKLAYTYDNAPPTDFYSITDFRDVKASAPSGIAVQLTITINNTTAYYDNEIVVLKVYPFAGSGNSKSTGRTIRDDSDCDGNNRSMAATNNPNEAIVAPNPADESVNISYKLSENEQVTTISIFDLLGRKVA